MKALSKIYEMFNIHAAVTKQKGQDPSNILKQYITDPEDLTSVVDFYNKYFKTPAFNFLSPTPEQIKKTEDLSFNAKKSIHMLFTDCTIIFWIFAQYNKQNIGIYALPPARLNLSEQIQKMNDWYNGKRKFNVNAASYKKLIWNLYVCSIDPKLWGSARQILSALQLKGINPANYIMHCPDKIIEAIQVIGKHYKI